MTGATDIASVLAHEGMRTTQVIGVPSAELELPEADAVVVALKSRSAPVEQAVHESVASLRWLRGRGAERFFFKVCSTFDSTPEGNIGPVADLLLEELGAGIVPVCPAFPANGRTVYRGHLFVGDRLLSESTMARHPLTPMTDADLVRVLGRQTRRRVGLVPHGARVAERLEELRADGVSYAICDALDDGELRALGEAFADLPLLVGGSGLALGLPDALRRRGLLGEHAGGRLPHPEGPAVVLAGSCSEATREQVRRLAGRHAALPVDLLAPDGIVPEALERLEAGPVLVYTTADPEAVARVQAELGAVEASRRAERVLGEVARAAVEHGARTVVVAGGETAGAVVQALGIRALAVGEELAPGVPWMRSLGDPPLSLVLKSGNFGGPDLFLDALAAVR